MLVNSSWPGFVPAIHVLMAPASANARREGCPNERGNMIYELRIYRCVPGRLPALLKRFESTTLDLWKKHGIRQAGFWTTLVGESNNDLTYMLVWESLAEREQKWNAFASDPEWLTKRADSERDGPIVETLSNQILAPTSFSSVK
jgi:hypothetical protein